MSSFRMSFRSHSARFECVARLFVPGRHQARKPSAVRVPLSRIGNDDLSRVGTEDGEAPYETAAGESLARTPIAGRNTHPSAAESQGDRHYHHHVHDHPNQPESGAPKGAFVSGPAAGRWDAAAATAELSLRRTKIRSATQAIAEVSERFRFVSWKRGMLFVCLPFFFFFFFSFMPIVRVLAVHLCRTQVGGALDGGDDDDDEITRRMLATYAPYSVYSSDEDT